MNEQWYLLTAFPIGFGLGYFYFGMLWLTVRQLPSTQWPARLFVGSFVGRMAVVLLGMYWVADGQWTRSLVCLAGILLARIWLTHRLQPQEVDSAWEEGQHGN